MEDFTLMTLEQINSLDLAEYEEVSIQYERDEFYLNKAALDSEQNVRLNLTQKSNSNVRYFLSDTMDKVTGNKIYNLMNENQLFSEFSILDLLKEARNCNGKTATDVLLSGFQKTRKEKIRSMRVVITESEGEDLVHKYKNGKKLYNFKGETGMSEPAVDLFKRYLPIATNGQTYYDIIKAKDGFHIFPHFASRFHTNKHIGSDFKQYMANRAGLFQGYCLAVGKCLSCGKCSEYKAMQSIVNTKLETGAEHFDHITRYDKDLNPNQKLLIECVVDRGPYSAMSAEFLRNAMIRALLKTVDSEDLVKSLIAERSTSNTRQGYRVKSDSFKSLVAGSLVYEFSINAGFHIRQSFFKEWMKKINNFTTEGWKITNLKLVSPDFILRNAFQWTLTEYRFDDRKVNNIDLQVLRKKIKQFNNPDWNLGYKKQVVKSRDLVKNEVVIFDKSKVQFINCGIGANQHECKLTVLTKSEDNQPLIFLSGFLAEKEGKPKAYNVLQGVDVSIVGFYEEADKENVFEVNEKQSFLCEKCNKPKLINCMSGMAFGGMEYEQDVILKDKYKKGLCIECFSQLSI